ncbi:hypothetical protein Golob_013985, partial [Gossypium lobatum]|nr:hypothetical protein [Gossypium lobatum]
DKRITRIQIGHQNLQGTLPSDLQNLVELERLEIKGFRVFAPEKTPVSSSSSSNLMPT